MAGNGVASLATQIFDKYRISQTIVLDDLLVVENLITLSPDCKKDLISSNFDGRLTQILNNSGREAKEEWFIEAKRVLALLHEDTHSMKSLQEIPVKEDESDTKKRTSVTPFMRLSQGAVSADTYQLLTRGYDVKVFLDDGSSRWMHIFIANDLGDIRCKRPNENFIKPKWILKLYQLKSVTQGYDKSSPIRNSSEFYFKKLPKQELCFSLYGEHRMEGQRNFHVLVDSVFMARRLFEGFQALLNAYKKQLTENLKRDQPEAN